MIKELFSRANIILNDEQADKFARYSALLSEYNEKFNLTAITDPTEIIIKHFIDSASGAEFIPKNAKIIDIGSGAGFPAIPILILRPDLDFTLLDSLQKRVNFLQIVLNELNLTANCVHSRAEDAGKGNFREKFDVAVARAVAPLNILCEYGLPLIKVGGKFLAYKGGDVEAEIKTSENAVKILGGGKISVNKFELIDGSGRSVIEIEKSVSTPKRYPRGQNKPRLYPL